MGGVDAGDVTYPLLLSILRANNLAVVEIEGRMNVIPVGDVRFYPAPFASGDDGNIAADEWRTRVVQITNVEAAQLVPILRRVVPERIEIVKVPFATAIQWACESKIIDSYSGTLLLRTEHGRLERILGGDVSMEK